MLHNIDNNHYYPHDYDTIKIDKDYKIHSSEYQDLIGSVKRDTNGNVYLHFKDPSHQVNIYYEKSFNDGTLLFSTQDEDGDLLCLKIKKGECRV